MCLVPPLAIPSFGRALKKARPLQGWLVNIREDLDLGQLKKKKKRQVIVMDWCCMGKKEQGIH
jgi:hypothetical protein